jgi:hypothetical protein
MFSLAQALVALVSLATLALALPQPSPGQCAIGGNACGQNYRLRGDQKGIQCCDPKDPCDYPFICGYSATHNSSANVTMTVSRHGHGGGGGGGGGGTGGLHGCDKASSDYDYLLLVQQWPPAATNTHWPAEADLKVAPHPPLTATLASLQRRLAPGLALA